MAAALALAITLVVVVAVLSLAVNSQGQLVGGQRASSPRTGGSGTGPAKQPRRPPRERGERSKRDRATAAPSAVPAGGPERPSDPDQAFSDLRPLNKQAPAIVMSVIDERTLGPVTRCRLTLRVQPREGQPFEVTTRVAFPTPEERAKVKVGATVPVRYDSEDHRRVVVEMDRPAGG
jgi:hypothetical protein